MTLIDMPKDFDGTAEEAAANRDSHSWAYTDPEEAPECWQCDAKSWHRAANYPCGAYVPRVVVCTDCMAGVLHEHTAEEARKLGIITG